MRIAFFDHRPETRRSWEHFPLDEFFSCLERIHGSAAVIWDRDRCELNLFDDSDSSLVVAAWETTVGLQRLLDGRAVAMLGCVADRGPQGMPYGRWVLVRWVDGDEELRWVRESALRLMRLR